MIKMRKITVVVLFLAVFNGLVTHCLAGQATLSWTAPTTNVDGTLLTDLAGYKIYYGTASGNYPTVINVNNVLTHTISGLTDGMTYYFVATAYDFTYNESNYSNEVSKAVTGTTGITAPTALRVSVNGGIVTLNWDKPNVGNVAIGYQISQGNTSGLYTAIYDVGSGYPDSTPCIVSYSGCERRQYILNRVAPGIYYFAVRTYSISTESNLSNEVNISINPDSTIPADVSNFTATAFSTGARLSWTNPPTPDFSLLILSYSIFGNIGPWTKISDLKGIPSVAQTYDHLNLQMGKTYYYKIQTRDTSGNTTSTRYTEITLPKTSDNPQIDTINPTTTPEIKPQDNNPITIITPETAPEIKQQDSHPPTITNSTTTPDEHLKTEDYADTDIPETVVVVALPSNPSIENTHVENPVPIKQIQNVPSPEKKKKKEALGFGCGTTKNNRPSGGNGTDISVFIVIILFLTLQGFNKKEKKMKKYLMAIFMFMALLFGRNAVAGQTTISWEYPEKIAIKGFNLYIVSIDNQYTESYYIDSENRADTEKYKSRTLTLYGLIPGIYHFWTKAVYYDKNIESVPSKLQKIIVPTEPDLVNLEITQTDAKLQFSWISPPDKNIVTQHLAHRIGKHDYSPGYTMQYAPQLQRVQASVHYTLFDEIGVADNPYYEGIWTKPHTFKLYFTDSDDKLIAIAETLLFVKQYCE